MWIILFLAFSATTAQNRSFQIFIHANNRTKALSSSSAASTAANQHSRATILFAIALTQWMTTAVVAGDKYLNEWVVNTRD